MRRGLLVMVVVGVCAVALAGSSALAAPQTYVVTSASDDGDGVCDASCTLRDAITNANGNADADTIHFNIPGAGPHTIGVTALPIIEGGLTIDATTQPSPSGTPMIELDGLGAGSNGIWFNFGASGLVRGLSLTRWQVGIITQASTTVVLEDNYIGLAPDGSAKGNATGVEFGGGSNHVVGGPDVQDANVISGNFSAGLRIKDVSGATVQGNLIGTDTAGSSAVPNGAGIEIFPTSGVAGGAFDVTIGGAGAGEGNVISGNTTDGIEIQSGNNTPGVDDTTILGNRIGTNRPGNSDVPNGGNGIVIRGSTNNSPATDTIIGGTGAGEGNTIAFNGLDGVFIDSRGADPEHLRNSIRGNAIHSNGTMVQHLGIDLGANGVTANDPPANLDADTGANDLQNFPEFTIQVESTVAGELDSAATQNYTIDVYSSPSCDAGGNGEGLVFVESVNVTTDGSGQDTFSTTQPLPYPGGFVTATATDSNGNTSEFGPCFDVVALQQPGPTYTVNTSTDTPTDAGCSTADCTLREAIVAANDDPGPTSAVEFDILGTVPHTIQPGTQLPPVGDGITIDGTTQDGFVDTPVIEIDGSTVSVDGGDGLQLAGTSSTVRGLAINDFSSAGSAGILVSGASNVVEGNYVGTNLAGNVARPNRFGIEVTGNDNTVGGETAAARNVISGNTSDNVRITGIGATTNTVAGNYIGTTASGIGPLGGNGVRIESSASNNTIGGITFAAHNVIAGNDGNGVEIIGDDSTGNDIRNNYIGMGATGLAVVSNTGAGVEIVGPDGNNQVYENLISGNSDGVVIGGSEASTAFQGVELNRIGLDEVGGEPGNSGHGIYLNGRDISDTSDSTINGNTIARSGGDGIRIDSTSGTAVANAVYNNRVWNSGGLAIDLVDDTELPPGTTVGVTPNDDDDVDGGANRFQNFPVLTAATVGSGETVIEGTLNSTPGRSFAIEFFFNPACDPSGNGEAEDGFGGTTVTTSALGDADISDSTPVELAVGDWVTALARDLTTGDTSELSACVAVVSENAPFTVNTVSDSPSDGCTPADCTLREAIEAANADPDASTIEFDIEGDGPHVIVPGTALPPVVEDVTIDGRTEPDWTDSPVVGLDGQLAVATGLEIADNSAQVAGLAIGGFTSYGINADGGQLELLASRIGTSLAGTTENPNGVGVRVQGSGHVIGDAGDGNVISGNIDQGVLVEGANNLVQGNRIGTNPLGIEELPNTTGIEILSTSADALAGNRIGGDQPGEGNVISGNTSAGVLLRSLATGDGVTETEITGNLIGIAADGTTPLGNGGDGVQLGSVGNLFGNTIGGTLPGEANRIAHNDGAGVSILDGGGTNRANRIAGNSVHSNGGIGIDLGAGGPTPNDTLDADTGANDLQNFPVLTSASPSTLSGSLHSEPNQTYQIHVYENSSCGEGGWGTTYLASFPVISDGAGDAPFTDAPLNVVASGLVSATATDAEGNTSELSNCIAVTIPTYVVNDDGASEPSDPGCDATECQLNEAIDAANADPGPGNIVFELADGTEIALSDQLPDVTDTVTIDGSNFQEGPPVTLREATSDLIDGLTLAPGSEGSILQDLHFRDFSGGAAVVVESDENAVRRNLIRTSDTGVLIHAGAAGNLVGGSVPANQGNRIWDTQTGIELDTAGAGNELAGNTLGLAPGDVPQAVGGTGIFAMDTPSIVIGHNVGPGGLGAIDGSRANVIVRQSTGIFFESGVTGSVVAGNLVGVNRTGAATDLGNGGNGLEISSSDGNQLGPGNTVAYNGTAMNPVSRHGIRLDHSTGDRIVANSIHSNVGLGISLNASNNGIAAPTLFTAVDSGAGTASVSGEIEGPSGLYFVEFFENAACDPGGSGEGETYRGFAEVQITNNESALFDADTFPGVAAGDVLTATLTRATGPAETSQFSECTTVATAEADETPAPVLFGAVADVRATETSPFSLGVSGLVDSGLRIAGQAFDVEFFSALTCNPETATVSLGEGLNFLTNGAGLAGFKKDGLTDVDVGTIVVATATPAGGGPESAFSNCVIADRNNTSWHNAHPLAPNGGDTGALRASGQARWFKVPILPNSRVDVSLTNLPDDYDMIVFSDIRQAYERLVGTDVDPTLGPNLSVTDLQRAGAETQTDVFNTSQYDRSSWEPTNWDPTLNTESSVFFPSEWSPSEWSPSEWSASQWSPSEWSPSEWSPSEWSPSEWSPSEWSPSEWSPSQWSASEWSDSNPADPRAFSSAQTASLLAVSAGPGTGDETVSVNTWNNTGDFYVRVQGKNGAFDPGTPFSLSVTRQGSMCENLQFDERPPEIEMELEDPKTLILMDGLRLPPGLFIQDLNLLADRDDVAGHIVDVNADPAVHALNQQADDPRYTSCPFAKNLVASAIKRIVAAYREEYPTIEYLVVVGDDSVIPFFRYPDPALMGNETLYVPPVRDNTASQASLRLGYILTDDFLSSTTGVAQRGNLLPVPDLASGRLVETPQEIAGMLDAYLGTNGGVVPTPTSSLVTGYDFLTDAADDIAGSLREGIGATGQNRTLITDQAISPGDLAVQGAAPTRDKSWTADNLRSVLLGPERNDLVFLAGHFSANDALAADYKTNVLSTEVPAAPTNMQNTIVFSAGCHAGYNIVNGHATTWTEPLDWAQAFAAKRATLIAGTGYQYGDTDFLAHGERLYAEFARQLLVTTKTDLSPEPVAVGSALLRSKQRFLEATPGLTALDEKSLLQTTLFGLPMLSVNMPEGRIPVPQPDSIVEPGDVQPVTSGPGAELGLKSAVVDVGSPELEPLTLRSKALKGLDPPALASWLEGPDGVAVRPTQPILPLSSLDVTSPNPSEALRGVAFRGGTYRETGGTTPLTAAPATELRGIHAPFFSDVFFPTQPWTTNYFSALGGGPTFLHVTPVQHRSESPTMTRRVFDDLDLQLFYSGNVLSYCPTTSLPVPVGGCLPVVEGRPVTAVTPALAAPPTITGVQTSLAGTVLTVRARVVGDPFAGIQTVFVTWTVPPGPGSGPGPGPVGEWQSFNLTRDPADPALWTGTLNLGQATAGDVNFAVQAVNGVGRVTIDDNVGSFYRPGSIPGAGAPPGQPAPAATQLTFAPQPSTSVTYGDSFPVTVQLTSGVSPVPAGKPVKIGLGAVALPAVTVAGGFATAQFQATLAPGLYRVTASFAGDANFAQSDATAMELTRINPRPTTLTLGGSFTMAPSSVYAELEANPTTANPSTPLHQRTLFLVFRGTGPANVNYTDVFTGKTDPTGRVDVTTQFLAALPAGSYRIDAYFNGVTLPGNVVVPPDSPEYVASTASVPNFVFRPGALDRLDQAVELLQPLAALPGARGDKAEDALAKVRAAIQKLSRTRPERVGALGELEGAAGDLEAAIKSRLFTAAELRPILDLITGAAWAEALAARDRALARPGAKPSKIAEATTSINQGNQRWAQSRWKEAIARYKDAVTKADSA